jgi:hypothetical protein
MGSEGHPSGLAGGYVGQNPEDRPGSHQCIGEEDDKGFKPLCLDERGNTPAGKRIRSR